MRHANSQTLFAYWQSVRGRAPAPERAAIRPKELVGILGNILILEASQRVSYPVRLAGDTVCRLFGREIAGSDILDLVRRTDRGQVSDALATVADTGAVALATAVATTVRGETAACELLLVPLRHTGPGYSRLLGCLTPLEAPDWLTRQAINSLALREVGLHQPARPQQEGTALLDGIPAAAAGLPQSAIRRRGRFLVIDGGGASSKPPPPPRTVAQLTWLSGSSEIRSNPRAPLTPK